MYSSSTIANYFLSKGWREGIKITPMQIVKLVYIAHGWHLAYKNQSLIGDRVLAWPYGPIIPELYFQVNHYKDNPITTPIASAFRATNHQVFNDELCEFLDTIWEHYKQFSPLELSTLTHEVGTPWRQVTHSYSRKNLAKNSIIIPNEIILHYYKSKLTATESSDYA